MRILSMMVLAIAGVAVAGCADDGRVLDEIGQVAKIDIGKPLLIFVYTDG